MSHNPGPPLLFLLKISLSALSFIFCGFVLSILSPTFGYTQLGISGDSIQYLIQREVNNRRSASIAVGTLGSGGRHFYSYGKIRDDSDAAPDENTVYEIGSITKVFKVIILADMVLKKEVNLNDRCSHTPKFDNLKDIQPL
jgi:CubicO group peptidase (beta-lactamase class C family)